MLLFITAVKEILIIISVFLVLSFQDSVSLQDTDYVLLLQFVASSRLFARALSYVALSRCTTLEGLYIVGKKISTEHFKQTFGGEDGEIKVETARLRRFQGNTLRKGHEAACVYSDSMTFDPNETIVFTHDEPEFDGS
jgi:hypothetical protein